MHQSIRRWGRPLALLTSVAVVGVALAALSWGRLSGQPVAPRIQGFVIDGATTYAIGFEGIYKANATGGGWTRLEAVTGKGDELVASGSTLFVAGSSGVWKSTDGGATFAAFNTGLPEFGENAFTGDLTSDGTSLYLSGNSFDPVTFASEVWVWKSPMDTANWTAARTGLPAGQFVSGLRFGGGKVWARVSNSGVYSTTDGSQWTSAGLNGDMDHLAVNAAGTALYAISGNTLHSSATGAAGSWTSVSIPAETPDSELNQKRALCVDADGSAVIGLAGGALVRRGGGVFTDIDTAPFADLETRRATVLSCALAGSELLVAFDGVGVYRVGASVSADSAGLDEGHIESLHQPAAGTLVAYYLPGGVFVSTDSGATWARRDTGLPVFHRGALAAQGTNLVIAGSAGTTLSVFRSADLGQTWTAGTAFDFAFVNDLTSDGTNWYVATDGRPGFDGIWKSTDAGATWTRKMNGVTGEDGAVGARGVVIAGSRLLMATNGAGVWASTDGGENWTAANTGLPRNASVGFDCCYSGPYHADGVSFVGKGNNFFRSTDGGVNWSGITTLPQGEYGSFITHFGADADGNHWALDEHAGYSYSTDDGATWVAQCGGVPKTSANTVVRGHGLVDVGSSLIVGTGGAGLLSTSGTTGAADACTVDASDDGGGHGGGNEEPEPVTSFDTSGPGGVPVNLATSAGSIDNVTVSLDVALGVTPPAGVSFPLGFYGFEITGLTAGASATVTLTFPAGTVIDGYWKFGPEPGDASNHVWQFTHDGTTGAQISGNTVTLTLVDGGRGDADGVADGVITDPGAPALGTPTGGGGFVNPFGNGSGGCTLGAPGQPADPTLLVLALLALAGLARRRTARV